MTADKVFEEIGQDAVNEYVYDVVCVARELFKKSGNLDDFCLQHTGCASIIFGGRNRLVWNPTRGLRADRSYCDEKFLAEFDKWTSFT